MSERRFLSNREAIDWELAIPDLNCEGVIIGKGSNALEIVVARGCNRPTKSRLERAWRYRRGQRPNPVLLVALYEEKASICGPSGDSPSVHIDLDQAHVERICNAALNLPNRHAVYQFFRDIMPQIGDRFLGIRNQGLLSTHELKVGVPRRTDWIASGSKSLGLLSHDDKELIRSLGYRIEQLKGQGYLLKDGERETAVAIFLREDEAFVQPQERFMGQSPVAYALKKAEDKRLDYVLVSAKKRLRLYTTDPSGGFGSRGRTDTFVEVNLDLLAKEQAGYLWLLFSVEALRENGTLQEIIESSRDYAADLGRRFRERVYGQVIPSLTKSISKARDIDEPCREELDEIYRVALWLLYRLLLVAYAEDEQFLPRGNLRYDERSLKKKSRELQDVFTAGKSFDSFSTSHWNDVSRLFEAIHDGNREWSLPEYDGKLFSSDPRESKEGAVLAEIQLTNDVFGPILADFLLDETEEGYKGPIDFRNLGVREFGEIYEGLLESELSIAEHPLAIEDVDGRQLYVPVDDPEKAEIMKGEIYLHGSSGERKSSGTYYTKTPFIEHLLDNSLEPALDDHIKRLNQLSNKEAQKRFFDFRVADIAMGSGHFLVAAIDRIENRLTSFLAERSLPRINNQLSRLRDVAKKAYENEDDLPEIDDSQLLRRQIARRCIYGVDLNPLATELARLSIWVHTFVPGLPLTFLDHNLVCGDSLSGIGTLGEAAELVGINLDKNTCTLDYWLNQDPLEQIKKQIRKLGRLADADAEEVKEARETQEELNKGLRNQKGLFDIIAASRITENIDPTDFSNPKIDNILELTVYKEARETLDFTNPIHFPIVFPEIFQDENPGFDVIVGNPPWEEETLERDSFWMRYSPGLQGKTQTKRENLINRLESERPDLVRLYQQELREKEAIRRILINGPFPGMGTGDPDLYKAFCWRFWNLIRHKGYAGVVLPRSVFITKGSEEFRRNLLDNGIIKDLTFLTNKQGWVFDHAEHRYTISLLCFKKQEPDKKEKLPLRGPYIDMNSFNKGIRSDPYRFSLEDAKNWTGTAAFPLLPDNPHSLVVFEKLSNHTPLSLNEKNEWYVRPHTELHATNDKMKSDGTILMHFTEESAEGFWPICKGASFNLWNPDTGIRYAWADPKVMLTHLQEKRNNSFRLGKKSAFFGMPKEWASEIETLPCLKPRIVFRDIARATDSRTIIASLVPPKVFFINTAPYLIWLREDEKDQAYLLGVMCSIPFDWYARRFVETHVNYHILNALPVPRPSRGSKLWKRVVELSGRLASVDERFDDWAKAVGVDWGPLDEKRKYESIFELDALVANLYGLTEEDLKIIFKTFHKGWDPQERVQRVTDFYKEWSKS